MAVPCRYVILKTPRSVFRIYLFILFVNFLALPVLPEPFPFEMAYLIFDSASQTGFPDKEWDFEIILN
jgi:hypothetical protein